ncbi:FAD binding domain-containing protein [Mycobacterium sp. NPDC003449]
MIPDFALSRPGTLDEALGHLAEGGTAYAGGTELVAAMHLGVLSPEHLVDLKRVAQLSGVTTSSTRLTIGATTRHRDVAGSAEVRRHAAMLATACSLLGNARVRATGSIGGNICFADPRSDVTTSLFALRAEVTLRSTAGWRTLPIEDFVLGAMETDRSEDELLEAIHIPIAEQHHVYLRHQPAEYPTVCIGVVADRAHPPEPVRIVVGAVGERPQPFNAASIDDVDLGAILPGLDVLPDLNGSEEYKRHLAGVFISRAVARMKETIDA